jgi:error-prone DNA polymerase
MYAELHIKTNFSFLEGASHPDELVRRAAELGYCALAVTDRNSLAGVVRAHMAAKDVGLKLIVGAQITPDDAPPVVLWATDRAAYGRLARLITQGRRRAEKGDCRLCFEDVAQYAEGLLVGVSRQWAVGSRQWADVPSAAKRQLAIHHPAVPLPTADCRLPTLHNYRDLFADRCYLLAELHRGPDDRGELERLRATSRRTRIPLVAAGDVHYHVPQRAILHDVLTAIRHGCTLSEATGHLFANAQRHLKWPAEMAALFADAPDALRRTLEIADRCTFSLDQLRYEYPKELAPAGLTPSEYLARLTWAGARRRYPRGVPEKVRRLLEHELQLIGELQYEAYFLTVWDLVRFARRRGILCQGRGSAANSAVCYCLGITAVDPQRMDVLFERFVSRERNEAPDIDVDFEHQRREEVIQYLYRKYGREHAGITAEVITYRPRSAVRDVGKALGLPAEEIDRLAERIEHSHEDWKLQIANCKLQIAACSPHPGPLPKGEGTQVGQQFVDLVDQLIGFPRHLSQHTGGMVMTRGPLCELVPIENAAMPDRTVIQWNKDDLDELGILKVDCLALGMLTALRRALALVRRHYGRKLTLAGIPEGDEAVYAMIRRADTMGVFQIESRAQMSMLPRLRPRSFYDLVIEVAIVRPGPIQGDMVHPYLRRRSGEEAVTYPSDSIRGVLEKTLGVPLFQEQAMRLAVVAAGFTPGEADQLRRAMGAWRRPGLIDQFRRKLIDGMRGNGFPAEYAEAVFRQIRGFGDYGFPESHAASFALLVYVSAWLKHHYPAAFTAALLNSQPMGFYAPAQLVRNAREHDVEVRPVDVNFSEWDCTLEEGRKGEAGRRKAEGREQRGEEVADGQWPGTGQSQISNLESSIPDPPSSLSSAFPLPPSAFHLRLGFNVLLGMSAAQVEQIQRVRRDGPFRSLEDFARRTGLSRAVMTRLAKAGTFGSLQPDRRAALWEAIGQDMRELPLWDKKGEGGRRKAEDPRLQIANLKCEIDNSDHQSEIQPPESKTYSPFPLPPSAFLPSMSPAEEVLADYRTAGLSLRAHPMQFLRGELEEGGVATAGSLPTLPDGKAVRVAGLVLVRQRPGTAKGITFVTLEDETGTANLIVRLSVWKCYREAAVGATVLLAQGRLQRQGEVIHVLTTKLEDLSPWMRQLGSQSRDFR